MAGRNKKRPRAIEPLFGSSKKVKDPVQERWDNPTTAPLKPVFTDHSNGFRTVDETRTYHNMEVFQYGEEPAVLPADDAPTAEWERLAVGVRVPDVAGAGSVNCLAFPVQSRQISVEAYEELSGDSKRRCVWDESSGVWHYCARNLVDGRKSGGRKVTDMYLANLVSQRPLKGNIAAKCRLVLDWEFDPATQHPRERCLLVSTQKVQKGFEYVLDTEYADRQRAGHDSDLESDSDCAEVASPAASSKVRCVTEFESSLLDFTQSTNIHLGEVVKTLCKQGAVYERLGVLVDNSYLGLRIDQSSSDETAKKLNALFSKMSEVCALLEESNRIARNHCAHHLAVEEDNAGTSKMADRVAKHGSDEEVDYEPYESPR